MNTIEHIIFIILNLFRIYTIFRFTSLFFDRSTTKLKIEISAFTIYFIINTSIAVYFSIPLVNLFTNIILYFTITFIYKGKLSIRFISTVLMYALAILVEGTIYTIMAHMVSNTDITIAVTVVSNICLYMLILILLRVFDRKEQYKMNIYHWIAIFLVPTGSIFVTVVILLNNYNIVVKVISTSILFLINILIFYLYDLILISYMEKFKTDLLIQQNNAYMHQFNLMETSIQNMKMLRHDFKNHVYIMQSLLKKNHTNELEDYLTSTLNFINLSDEYVSTDNRELDSILNYKLYEVKKLNIEPNICVQVPPKLGIDIFDLNIILSNLLDNAIRALQNDSRKLFDLNIRFDREVLYIRVKNSYSDKILFSNNSYITTKSNCENHGIGLSNVENIVNKYNGIMTIEREENVFSVCIILYNNSNNNRDRQS